MIVERAIALAARLHAGQRDRLGDPYIFHPLRVMFAMPTAETRAAAVLHDVVEDSPCTLDDLREAFPEPVVTLVDLMTRLPGQRYDDYIARLAAASPEARALKRADLRDNIAVRRRVTLTSEDREKLARYRRALRLLHA